MLPVKPLTVVSQDGNGAENFQSSDITVATIKSGMQAHHSCVCGDVSILKPLLLPGVPKCRADCYTRHMTLEETPVFLGSMCTSQFFIVVLECTYGGLNEKCPPQAHICEHVVTSLVAV